MSDRFALTVPTLDIYAQRECIFEMEARNVNEFLRGFSKKTKNANWAACAVKLTNNTG